MSNSFFNFMFKILILFFVVNLAQAKEIHLTFDVHYIEGSPDGVYKKSILGINGKFPGPTIEANLGDILIVDVINNIQNGQNVSIHWHGIHQRNSPSEDGTNMVTQCPLKSGYTQRYRVALEQTGTYWYHSHVKSQYTEGLWGALIIHNKPEVYKYDGEIIITLNDWYHRTAIENEEWHVSNKSRGVPPYPDSGMINGLGRYNCIVAKSQKRKCSTAKQTRTVFKVLPEKVYRVRVINTAAVAVFNFSIDGHKLETIEIDGIDVFNSTSVDIVSISVGQRFSFLIHTDGNELVDRYLIRANIRNESLMLLEGNVNINQNTADVILNVTAVLEYSSKGISSKPNPIVVTTEQHSYLEVVTPMKPAKYVSLDENNDLLPCDKKYAPSHYDQEFVVNATFKEDFQDIRRASFNYTPFILPDSKPLLMTFLDNETIPNTAFPLEIGYMNVIQVVVNNPFYGPHPFHLHGHSFWVVGTGLLGDGDYNAAKHNLTLTVAQRDTAFVQEQSWAVIRFVADNPGLWTFHCHIDWHNLSGMALVFVEGREEAIKRKMVVSDEAKRVCGLWLQ